MPTLILDEGKAKTHPAGPLISNAFIKYRSIPPTVKMPKILFVDFMLSLNVDLAKIKNQQNTCNIVTGTIRWTRVIQIVCFVYIIIFSGCYQHSWLSDHSHNRQSTCHVSRSNPKEDFSTRYQDLCCEKTETSPVSLLARKSIHCEFLTFSMKRGKNLEKARWARCQQRSYHDLGPWIPTNHRRTVKPVNCSSHVIVSVDLNMF